jgi:transcriptional regulator with XRE-family HTH domain
MASEFGIRNAESVADPGGFAASAAWARLVRWNYDLVNANREDAKQLCLLVNLEAVAAGLTTRQELFRLAARRVREFARDYGYGRFWVGDHRERHDAQTVSLDELAEMCRQGGEDAPDADGLDILIRRKTTRSILPNAVEMSEVATRCALARNVRRFRQRRGISRCELARRSGISYTTVRLTEENLTVPRLDVVFAVAHAMDLGTQSLFNGQERRPSIPDWMSYLGAFFSRLALLLRLAGRKRVKYSQTLDVRQLVRQQMALGQAPVITSIVRLSRIFDVRPSFLVRELGDGNVLVW